MTINELVEAAHTNAKAHGFWEGDDHNLPEKLCLIHSEISEALEEIRALEHPSFDLASIWHTDSSKPCGFAIEIADAVIRIADLCGHIGIDLETAVKVKHEYNKSRPHKHGKAF